MRTYTDVEAFEAIARRSSKSKDLRPSICNTDLEIPIGILLLKNDTDGLFYVNEEPSRGRRLVVMRQSSSSSMTVILKERSPVGIVAVQM